MSSSRLLPFARQLSVALRNLLSIPYASENHLNEEMQDKFL
jgi:hypothetical protein